MTDNKQAKLLFQKEAQKALDEVSDKKTRDLAGAFLTVLYRESIADNHPRSDLDYEFLVRVLVKFCEKHELIRSILAGGDVGAWPE